MVTQSNTTDTELYILIGYEWTDRDTTESIRPLTSGRDRGTLPYG
jgi:hypothetical protein